MPLRALWQYAIVIPIEPMEKGAEWPEGTILPMHCTVVPWFTHSFTVCADTLVLPLLLYSAAIPKGELVLVSDRRAYFGPDNSVPVHTLVRNTHLTKLHTFFFRDLVRAGVDFDPIQWVGAGYSPHVTDTADRQFLPGESFVATHTALIFRKDGIKRVVWKSEVGEDRK